MAFLKFVGMLLLGMIITFGLPAFILLIIAIPIIVFLDGTVLRTLADFLLQF